MERIGVFCASSSNMDKVYYDEAQRFAEWLGRRGKTLVYGGSKKGMMEVMASVVRKEGGKVFGVVPRKIVERNLVSDNIDIIFHTDRLSDRKEFLIGESDVMVVLPGSVGTLDEAFTAMAGYTFGEHAKPVVFWNINGFWDGLFDFLDGLSGKGVVNKPFSDFVYRADTLEELTAILDKFE